MITCKPSRILHGARFLAGLMLSMYLTSMLLTKFGHTSNFFISWYSESPAETAYPLPQDVLLQLPATSLDMNLAIPQSIHQSWSTAQLPFNFSQWSRTWRLHHPEWKWKLWTDSDNRALVKKHFPWFLDTYQRLPHVICRADVARYMYLFLYGG